MFVSFTATPLFELSSGQDQLQVYRRHVVRLLRIVILLLTWVGLSVRAADRSVKIHDLHQDLCEHPCDYHHDHEHDDNAPCQEHDHHHCHCPSLTPLFCLPEFPVLAGKAILLVSSTTEEHTDWGLPEDPVYTPEVPPIIS